VEHPQQKRHAQIMRMTTTNKTNNVGGWNKKIEKKKKPKIIK
jgi:hypothetical protein